MNFTPQSGQVVCASAPTSSPTWATIRFWRMASRASSGGSSGGANPALRAQGVQRWTSRRRPSTVSVRWIDASSWHCWHVMTGPPDRGRSPPLLLLDGLDLVPDPGRGLVVLGGDGPLQVVAELDQGRLLLAGARGAAGNLARVPRLVVNVLQQGHQLVAEDLVIVGATVPARVPELEEGELAEGARLL